MSAAAQAEGLAARALARAEGACDMGDGMTAVTLALLTVAAEIRALREAVEPLLTPTVHAPGVSPPA